MSIVATEIESVHGSAGGQRIVLYRCQDHLGAWHNYGPVITTDDAFDEVAFKSTVAEKVARQLSEAEANSLLGS